jgi:hypothetical protein
MTCLGVGVARTQREHTELSFHDYSKDERTIDETAFVDSALNSSLIMGDEVCSALRYCDSPQWAPKSSEPPSFASQHDLPLLFLHCSRAQTSPNLTALTFEYRLNTTQEDMWADLGDGGTASASPDHLTNLDEWDFPDDDEVCALSA